MGRAAHCALMERTRNGSRWKGGGAVRRAPTEARSDCLPDYQLLAGNTAQSRTLMADTTVADPILGDEPGAIVRDRFIRFLKECVAAACLWGRLAARHGAMPLLAS